MTEQTVTTMAAEISTVVRHMLHSSYVLDPVAPAPVRRVRVACALGELLGRDPDETVHTLIQNVMTQLALDSKGGKP